MIEHATKRDAVMAAVRFAVTSIEDPRVETIRDATAVQPWKDATRSALRFAGDAIDCAYGGHPNFMTPHLVERGWVAGGILAYELSWGEPFLSDRDLYGLTFVEVREAKHAGAEVRGIHHLSIGGAFRRSDLEEVIRVAKAEVAKFDDRS